MKKYYRLIAGIGALLSILFAMLYAFVLDSPGDEISAYLALAFLLVSIALAKLGGKRVRDERDTRIAAKANKWALMGVIFFLVLVAIQEKATPGFITLRHAAGIGFAIALSISIVSFQILKRLPNAEYDKWER